MRVIQSNKSCLDIKMERTGAGWEQWFLLASDVHFDNPKCNRKLFYRHLDEAKNKKAKVLIFGDFYCFMQGKWDPRRSKGHIRPEHNTDTYMDTVIYDTYEKLLPYSEELLFISKGNHETALIKHSETDVLGRTAQLFNQGGKKMHIGSYAGFVRFQTVNKHDGIKRTQTLFYHHGKWGGAVNKGTQSSQRYSSVAPQADIIVSGHTHDSWYMSFPRYHLTSSGRVEVREQLHLKCGTYKEEFADLDGFAVEKIVIPKSPQMWWLRLYGNSQELHRAIMPAN